MEDNRKKLRLKYTKEGKAIYISHLDLMRAMQRAVKKAKIPVWYTEGYNPRIYLDFPLALSLGTTSRCENMDLYIIDNISNEEIINRMNSVLSEGIRITEIYEPKNNVKDIDAAEYEIILNSENDIFSDFEKFINNSEILVEKKSKKKGMLTINLVDYIRKCEYSKEGENGVKILITLPAGIETNINPSLLTNAFEKYCEEQNKAVQIVCTKRLNILCKSGESFV